MNFHSGKEAGTTFEKLFERQCQLAGIWAEANHIKARRGWKGKLQELKSNLDFTLIQRVGKVAFADCKTYDAPFLYLSKIDPHQSELAARYNDWGIPAGFVVWFRPINRVSFFPGWLVQGRRQDKRLSLLDGVELGTWERFDPLPIFQVPSGSPRGIFA